MVLLLTGVVRNAVSGGGRKEANPNHLYYVTESEETIEQMLALKSSLYGNVRVCVGFQSLVCASFFKFAPHVRNKFLRTLRCQEKV